MSRVSCILLSYNQIINNRFIYVDYGPTLLDGQVIVDPTVYVGSRNGDSPGWGSYCDEDAAIPYGSGLSDWDYATDNVVMQNQIYVNDPDLMIVTNNEAINSPNFVADNHTVTDDTVVERESGCYVYDGSIGFVLDSGSYDAGGLYCQAVLPGTCLPGAARSRRHRD